ncbi:hypothetical protein AB1J28_22840 [Lysinibacillus irui]
MSLTSFIEQQFKGRFTSHATIFLYDNFKNEDLPQQLEAQLHNAWI